MKNMYVKARSRIVRGLINMEGNDISYVFLSTGSTYVPDFNEDEFLDAVPDGILHGPVAVLNPDATNFGTAVEFDDQTISAFPAGTIGAVLVVKDTGNPATSPLICYTNEDNGGSPLAVVMNGTDDLNVIPDATTKILVL